ncbi:MAG: glucose/arabinose dehydrogenase [Planctomycetota bacterium]|jgi:glucose/arabinose dehydrogenase
MCASPPGDSRLFVVEREAGRIRVVDQGSLIATPFLDVGNRISVGGERGLLGLAFDPNFAQNRRFFVSYTDTNGASLVEEYRASAMDPNVADPQSAVTVFGPLPQVNVFHNAGCLQFGPDGKLYFSLGDDGRHQNGQDLAVPYGKLLRFDVDAPFPHVPLDNPFVGQVGIEPLIWAYGLRNPWRFSFDSGTEDLWIGDVGTFRRDEVDWIPAGSAGAANFGWSCLEGTECTNMLSTGCDCPDPTLIPPIYERAPHSMGCSLIGGVVYRGQEMPTMVGRYFCADWCGGSVTSFLRSGTTTTDLIADHGITPPLVRATSIDEGPGGELFMADMNSGRVFKFVVDCGSTQYCTAVPNSTGLPGQVSVLGSVSVAANNFTLLASDLPPGSVGYFVGSQNTGFIANPGGSQGNLCLDGTSIWRFSLTAGASGPAGQYIVPFSLTAFPTNPPRSIQAGDTWNFQLWHRDLNPVVTSNFSRGLTVVFCP